MDDGVYQPPEAREGPVMKIADSSIILGADHFLKKSVEKEETLTVWKSGQEQREINAKNKKVSDIKKIASDLAAQQAAKVNLSAEAASRSRRVAKIGDELSEEEGFIADLNIRILKAMIERITGRKIDIRKPSDFNGSKKAISEEKMNEAPPQTEETGEGFGLVYEYHESYSEYEKTDFSASGVIITDDGTEISFDTTLSMSRSFIEEHNINIRAGEALKDPLVVNFDGGAAAISSDEFLFDIDNDGFEDQLHFIEQGSGFLALDKNGDGEINNGSELFGALTGEGFEELGVYDSDGNNWIDENDEIYKSLRIWHVDQNGERILASLGSMGIGAIYLGNVDSPFSIKDADNNLQAEIRSTGIFVKEEGSVGTIQQVDLVV